MNFIRKNKWAVGLFSGVFLYAAFFGQGIPLWDDDFTSWFWKIQDKSLFHYFFEWFSPISTQPQYWGFNERPVQAIFYKLCFMISGYESWSYFFFKDLFYAGMATLIYFWGLRVSKSKIAALGGAVFFAATPGPMAAHVIQSDIAPIAELWFLAVTYFAWQEIERTPANWSGFPDFSAPAVRSWMKRWAVIAVLTYLGYKTKADLKLIPGIIGLYVLLLRRKQWLYFAFPLGLMVLLAVPWGGGIFTKLPPFVPGSKGSEIGWMFQPASLGHFFEFIWGGSWTDFFFDLRNPGFALLGLLGPFFLIPMMVFLFWKMEAFDKVKWTAKDTSVDRARIFAMIWLAVMFVGVSALAPINFIFRVRYGILTLVPSSILVAWVLGLIAQSIPKLPRWATYVLIVGFGFQCLVNVYRSGAFRRDMGIVMIAVDQAYEYIDTHFHDGTLALMPDFRPYDYRPSAGLAIKNRQWLGSTDELAKKYKPNETYLISWHASLWEDVEQVAHFSGCREHTLFDLVWPCPRGSGTSVMKYIGRDAQYAAGEKLRSKGDVIGARNLHSQFMVTHPDSLAGLFVLGLESYSLKDWAACDRAFARLEEYFPDHLPILYNHALALGELHRYDEAIVRLRFIAGREPSNYPVELNLYHDLANAGRKAEARELIGELKRLFPNDGEITRLYSQSAGNG